MAGAIGFSSFYGNSGHIRWLIVSWDTIVKANTVRMILNQVGLNCNWLSCSRGDFVISLHQTLERQVMTEAHRNLWPVELNMAQRNLKINVIMLAEQDIHIYLNLINENRTCRNGNRFDRCVLKYEYIVVLGQLILWQYVLPLPMYPIPTVLMSLACIDLYTVQPCHA